MFCFPLKLTDSLYVEANEPPLRLRRLKLGLQYIVKLIARIENEVNRGASNFWCTRQHSLWNFSVPEPCS